MPVSDDIFTHHADFDPAADLDLFLKAIPAKWVVYLMTDAVDRPVQLLCVKNLRASLKRRLGGDEPIGPTRRIDYRELIRHIHWRRVDSAFEADWIYYEAARATFPESYRGMVGFRPAWFIHVNPDSAFPRFIKTIDLAKQTGVIIGPLEDKHAAARLIAMAEDAFDLCRYYQILVQAPHANACAYKEMGKCPAPCDGSISMEAYRDSMSRAAEAIIDPAAQVQRQTQIMQRAAAALQFEVAAKAKRRIGQIEQFHKGAFRHVSTIANFAYVSLQHGPRAGTAKLFLIAPGHIEEVAALIRAPDRPSDLLRIILQRAAEQIEAASLDPIGAERVGVVSNHLFSGRNRGAFIRLTDVEDKSIAKAFKEVSRQESSEKEVEGEGVLKELQAI